MTSAEAKYKYGRGDCGFYVKCHECPLNDYDEKCPSDASGYEDCWSAIAKFITENEEDRSCYNCKFEDKDCDEEPCIDCKYNFVAGTKEYDEHDFLWKPVNSVEEEIKPNNVNHPSHYNQGGIECIDAMVSAFGREAVENFCLCNAFKYVWRNRDKNGFEDIDKAIWYLNKIKELINNAED